MVNSRAPEIAIYLRPYLRASFHRNGVNSLRVRSTLVLREQQNGHPKKFIHESASTSPAQCDAVIEDPKAIVCLPYVQRISEPLKRILNGLHIRTVMILHQTLKQRLVDMEKSGVIYCILCAECLATYVGETKRKLCKRMDEHKRAVRMADLAYNQLKNS